MNKDYRLLNEALIVLQEIKPWINAEYYRNNISSLVFKLRERLASIDAEKFKNSIIASNSDFSDTIPQDIPSRNHSSVGNFNNSSLLESNYGIFKELRGDNCKNDPRAPHWQLKELSDAMGRYVCKCEFWSP
jgi:hypothetical protein